MSQPTQNLRRAAPSLVAAILSLFSGSVAAAQERISVLLIGGANNHDHRWTTPSLRQILEESGRFAVAVTTDPAADLARGHGLATAQAVVLDYNGPRWGAEAEANFLAAVRGGVGVAVIHAANNAFPGWIEYEKLVGLMWREGSGHGRFHPFDVVVTDPHHPITRGMPDMRNHPDELYHRLVAMHDVPVRVLASAHSRVDTGGTGRFEPMVCVSRYGQGRVFHTPLGHVWGGNVGNRVSHFDPQFRNLVCRGTEWAATGAVTLPPEPINFLTIEEKQAGFRLLFDGRTTDGWRAFRGEGPPARGWSVQNGALVRGAGGGDLVTEETFGDFELRFQWRIAEGGNSGVLYHVRETHDQTHFTGLEYQVLDDGVEPAPKHSTGALYDLVAPDEKVVRVPGEWNDGRIAVRDGRVEHWLNGERILDAPRAGEGWERMVAASKFAAWSDFGVAQRGHIALQDHGSEVAFRNLRVRTFD